MRQPKIDSDENDGAFQAGNGVRQAGSNNEKSAAGKPAAPFKRQRRRSRQPRN
jgi:hypothetical protein